MLNNEVEFQLEALRETLPEVVNKAASGISVDVPYSLDRAKRIVNYRIDGYTFEEISREGDMPDASTLVRWCREKSEFAQMLRNAKDARAMVFEDEAIRVARRASGRDADRLKFDAYKWAAEVNDPLTYGKKVAHSGDANGAPVVLQIVTGFGPPNKWQRSPKLNADGTIDRSEDGEAEVRQPNTACSDKPDICSGATALRAIEGHSPTDGSEKSA